MMLLMFSAFTVLFILYDFPGRLEEVVCAFVLKLGTSTTLP